MSYLPSSVKIDEQSFFSQTKKKGSLFGGVLLLSGSCIGAGMLALPIFAGVAGFFPSLFVFVICWIFMMTTALLLVEATSWFPQEDTHLLSLAEKTLGKKARILVWGVFLFLFYSLLVAYLAKGGDLLQKFLEGFINLSFPLGTGSFLLTVLSIYVTYKGVANSDRFNRIGMLGLFLAFIYIMGYGNDQIHLEYSLRADWGLCLSILPFIVTSFGFHNMIPSIHSYLEKDQTLTIKVLLIGSLIPFVIYLMWLFKVFTLIPLEGEISLMNSYQNDEIATETLTHFFQNPLISICSEYFAFFAILTSIFGQALSIKDFFSDGFQIKLKTNKSQFLLCLATFIPPFVCSLISPHIFGIALELVGGVACMILFGIIPACIIWRGRYQLKLSTNRVVKGEKITLIAVLSFASLILCFELLKNLGINLL